MLSRAPLSACNFSMSYHCFWLISYSL